jgi:acetyltransferase-like isoleucine patch superfamily enzyme
MTSLWAPLALATATGAMLVLPLAPALWELWRREDAGPLATRKDDGRIQNFAHSFRAYVAPLLPALAACAERQAIEKLQLSDNTHAFLIGKDGTYNGIDQEVRSMLLFAREISMPAKMVFVNDIYSADSFRGAPSNVFRSLLGEKNVFLDEATQVLRWIHAEGHLSVGQSSHLRGRCSSATAIWLSTDCRFERIYAPLIVTAINASPQSPPAPSSFEPVAATSGAGRSRIQGNLFLGPQEVFMGTVVASGSVNIGKNSQISGSAKGNGDVRMDSNSQVAGSLVSTGSITIGRNCMIKGPVLAENEITIGAGAQIGSPDSLTTVSAPRIRIAHDCRLHGTVWARVEGRVVE